MNQEQILNIDKFIKTRAEEIYDFVSKRKSILYREFEELCCFDYYYIDEEDDLNTIVFVYETYEGANDISRCPIKYFSDNWKELIIKDEEVLLENKRLKEKQQEEINNKKEYQEFLRLSAKYTKSEQI